MRDRRARRAWPRSRRSARAGSCRARRSARSTGDGRLRCRWEGEVVGDMPAEALADAPRYPLHAERPATAAPSSRSRPADVPAVERSGGLLLRLLAAPNICAKTLGLRAVRPGRRLGHGRCVPGGDAGVVRLTPSERAIAVALDGDGARVALDPRRGGAEAVAQAALNVACSGAEPAAITNCLNFGNPERAGHGLRAARGDHRHGGGLRGARHAGRLGQRLALQRERRQADPPDARRRLRRACWSGPRPPCRWRRRDASGTLFLLGAAGAGSTTARSGRPLVSGGNAGRIPEVDLPALRWLCDLLGGLAREGGVLRSAHDASDGGLAVSLAELALAAGSRPRGRDRAARRATRRRCSASAAAWSSRAARPRTRRSWPRRATLRVCPSRKSVRWAARRSRCAAASSRSSCRSPTRARRTRARSRMRWRPADVRRLRHPRARPRRRPPGLLRALRAAAPRPGERGHRRLRRPARDDRARHGARGAGLRRGQAAGAAGARGDRARALLDHRLGALDELAADRAHRRAARSRSATTATSRTPTSCARS